MALLIRTSLVIALLICFACELNNCRVNKEVLNDPAAVWLLEPSSEVVKKVSPPDESKTSSSETAETVDRIDRPNGPHRFHNRRPVLYSARPHRPRGNEPRYNPTRPKWKNHAEGVRHQPTPAIDLPKKPPNNEIHIEVDSLDQIGDFLNNLFKNDNLDVEINAQGTRGAGSPLGKKPDVSSGVNTKWRPSASPHTPRPYTTTERAVIRTLPSAGRRPYTTSPRPFSFRGQYSLTTQYSYENFWVPPTTIPTVQNLVTFTPRDAGKQTTDSPEAAGHDTVVTSTATNQGGKVSESPWELFKNPFWGPPLTSTSPSPATSGQPTTLHSKKRPNKHSNDSPDDEDDEHDDDYSDEEDDDESDDEEEHLKSRQLDDNVPPPVAAAPVKTRNSDYGVQPYQAAASTYYTPPSPLRLDFSPLFLALIPIALFLGAAASFALSSAVTSSSAVATAQQQQQQQQEGNNNNANSANNNNANTILELLSALYQNNNNNNGYFNNFPYFLVVNETALAGRRKRRRVKRLLKLLD